MTFQIDLGPTCFRSPRIIPFGWSSWPAPRRASFDPEPRGARRDHHDVQALPLLWPRQAHGRLRPQCQAPGRPPRSLQALPFRGRCEGLGGLPRFFRRPAVAAWSPQGPRCKRRASKAACDPQAPQPDPGGRWSTGAQAPQAQDPAAALDGTDDRRRDRAG